MVKRRRKGGLRKTVKQLGKKQRRLSSLVLGNISTFTHRAKVGFFVACLDGQASYTITTHNSKAKVEVPLAILPMFDDDQSPPAITPRDMTALTSQTDIMGKASLTKINIFNSGGTSAEVRCYWYTAKMDSSTTPLTLFTSGFADQGITSSAILNVQLFPTDVKQISTHFKLEKVDKYTIKVGEMVQTRHVIKKFKYDPSYFDSLTSEFTEQLNSAFCLIRLVGGIAHDSVDPDIISTGSARIDCIEDQTTKFEYDNGGPASHFYNTTQNLGSISTSNQMAKFGAVITDQIEL